MATTHKPERAMIPKVSKGHELHPEWIERMNRLAETFGQPVKKAIAHNGHIAFLFEDDALFIAERNQIERPQIDGRQQEMGRFVEWLQERAKVLKTI